MDNLPQIDTKLSTSNRELLSNQTVKLINTLYPSYQIDTSQISNLIEKNPPNSLDKFTFYSIASCTIESTEDFPVFIKSKMEKYFTALHALSVSIAFGIISSNGKASLVLGVGNNYKVKATHSILSGLLPGVKLQEICPDFSIQAKNSTWRGLISVIPSTKVDNENQFFDISPIMRSLISQDYTLFFLASPIETETVTQSLTDLIDVRDACFSVSKSTISDQTGISESVSKSKSTSYSVMAGIQIGIGAIGCNASWSDSESISKMLSKNQTQSVDVQNGFALELMDYAEHGIERLKTGRNCGMWQMVATYSTNDEAAHDIIQASLKGNLSKPNPKLLPARSFSLSSDNANGQFLLFPTGMTTANRHPNPLCSMVTSSELGMVCVLPTTNVPNFELIQSKSYPLLADQKGDGIEVGCVADGSRPLQGMPFSLSEGDLNKHTFVCGITGSGKTTTVKTILKNCKKPFLVIESAKKEYRNIKLEAGSNPAIYTLGKPELNCPQINPFYIMAGVSPQTHIDFLKDLFNASFSFYGPMPYIFEKCLQNIYVKRGWNLTFGCHPKFINLKNTIDMFDYAHTNSKYTINSHKYLFPTMTDLKNEISRYIDDELQYDGEVAGNVKTAMKTRLESLCNGAKGFMFDTSEHLDMERLLASNAVFELEGLADDSDKALCVGLLLIFINEYRSVQKELAGINRVGLQHLLVVEEAHRLLKNISADNHSEMMGNPKGKAVEHFTNMISEMRAYGQGVIIAEQIPTKLAPDVIKNSSNKIIQRVVSADDQQLVANTIGIPREDALFLGTLKTGFALCHKEGMAKPVCVKVHSVDNILVKDEKLYNNDIDKRFLTINKSIAHAIASELIDRYTFKLLNTLFVSSDSACIESIEFVKEKIASFLSTNEIHLIPLASKDDVITNLISESIFRYLTFGVYAIPDLIRDELSASILNLLILPTNGKLDTVKTHLKKVYNEDLKKFGIHTITQMLKEQYIQDMDINGTIKKYFIQYHSVDIEDCHSAFEKILRRSS